MTMTKEMERLKSIMVFHKWIINELDNLNFITKSNNFDEKIEEYQDRLTETYKRIHELEEEENKWKSK